MSKFIFFDNNRELYTKMLHDIKNAKKYVYLETYIFDTNKTGKQFIKLLSQKAKSGIDTKILIDDFGSSVEKNLLNKYTKAGGKIYFFRKFKISYNIIHKNNHRDHRKLLIIDDKIVYIGSSNISEKHLNWREANIRIDDNIAEIFKKIFIQNSFLYNKHIYTKKEHLKPIVHKEFEIIRDVPSIKFKTIRKKELKLISTAKKEILIETPYFIPDKRFRKALINATKRGVRIIIVLPNNSDVKAIDILTQKYLGKLSKQGIYILFYRPQVLHSKLLLIDGKYFSIGSSNMDYRSSMHQFEINLFGTNTEIIRFIKNHFHNSVQNSESFDYAKWKRRPIIQKVFESIIARIRHLL